MVSRKGSVPWNFRHGLTGQKIYVVWTAMKQRCQNKNRADYPRYGGQGITVCKRWQKFDNFYADMGDPPKGMSLDRIDNTKGYKPSNCRWATNSGQTCNRDMGLGRISKYRGVYKDTKTPRSKPWRIQIRISGKRITKYFKTEKEAGDMYKKLFEERKGFLNKNKDYVYV